MLIQCTKKLLTELKVKPVPSTEEESLFSWHANILMVNRRKTLVLMNDSSRYMIVLHGLKQKDFKNIDKLIVQAIREMFREEGIKDEVIEKYLSQSKNPVFTTTKNRTLVARLNKACETVYFYEIDLIADAICQVSISKNASRFLVGNGKNDYIKPNEELYRNLEEWIGEPIFNPEAFILHVTLELEKSHVWRRIAIPTYLTFPDLHQALQIAFNWKDYHLHEFQIFQSRPFDPDQVKRDETLKPIVSLVSDEEAFGYDSDIHQELENGVKLSDYLPAEILYVYDFGDDWKHRIVVENVIDNYPVNYPMCLDGEGGTPPEDVGGEPGYEEFLKVTSDSTHPDYGHLIRWSISQGYAIFDVNMVNRMLKHEF